MVGGRFLGGSTDSDYIGFGSDGSIRRWTPELGTETAAYGKIRNRDLRCDGPRMAFGDKSGHVIVRSVPDGNVLENVTLPGAGTPARRISLTKDNVHLAVAMPDGPLKLFNLKTGAVRDIRLYGRNAVVEQLQFSPHGRLLAAVESSNFKILAVYDVDNGSRIAAISLSNQPGAKLFALANGRGFVTIDTGGRIVVHPVFENSEDFLAYLTKEFPDQLTPAQKRFYFID
jgi:WD40 repeat protein